MIVLFKEKVFLYFQSNGQFAKYNKNIYKNCKLHQAIFSIFYNVLLSNLAILLILRCSIKLC